ncbi:N-acetyltransferase family protein [Sphingomonas sp. ID0503]|uniref:GNAT family N-acetyltransferase n=1 Tax=Sphingomonas sp. ID0503 TaxID=3399691 RepID=UPI003AFB335F
MLIRPFEARDAEAVAAILIPTIRAGETLAHPRDMAPDDAVALWTSAERETFVAEADGAVVGIYYLRRNQDGGGAHVANCGYATAAGQTGKGVARAMCEHSIMRARERGFAAIQFNFVVSTNERAVALWQSCGFEIVGRLPGAFRHPVLGDVDALVMYRRV